MIPENITREHIIKALEEIDKSEVPPQRDSEIYDLEHNNKKYPPKYVISMANKYANHNELNPSAFSGGDESNRFLRSLGFTIINKNEQQLNDDEGVFSQQSHDFAPRLKQYLENKYLIKINEGVGRARLSFPSGTIVHVRGSIVLRDERGFYHLQEEDQKDIVGNDRRFFAAVFGTPERTFVFPKEALKTLFSSYPPTLQEGGKPKWYFDIRQGNDGRHYLKIRSGQANEVSIDNYLNKWDQIEDFRYGKSPNIAKPSDLDTRYFLIQVSRPGSENLLRNDVYMHQNWKDTPRDTDHGKVRPGDILVIYFASNSIEFQRQIKKVYRVDAVSEDNVRFNVSEIKELNGITHEVIKDAIQNGKIQNEIFNRIGQQGFNIAEIEESDFDQLLSLGEAPSSKPLLNFVGLQKFLLEEMQMQANYQPVMIKILLLSGNMATKESIAMKIKEHNPDKQKEDYLHIPVYDVLESHGIVRRHNNDKYVLNSADLTNGERQQLVALCNWKINNMPLQLDELIQAFDKNRTLFGSPRVHPEEAEKMRLAFVSDFSVETIRFLELDQYVIGKRLPTGRVNKASFCYRLLYKLDVLSGFGVKSLLDFGIYYSQENNRYLYRDEQKYASPQEAFNQIKSEILSILEVGKQYNADHDINNLVAKLNKDYIIERTIISKILSVYFPSDFVPIHSQKQIEDISKTFGRSIDPRDSFFLAQSRLLEIKNSHPLMSQWNNNDFRSFVWNSIVQRKSKRNEDVENTQQIEDKSPVSLFITGYTDENLKISKSQQVLGWVNNSQYLSGGSLVFVFNKDRLAIDTCFRIESKLIDDRLIWGDEIAENKKIYCNRWKAEIVSDGLNIKLEDIRKIQPFDEEPFQGLLRGNFPMPLDSPTNSHKYTRLRNLLLQSINQPYIHRPETLEPTRENVFEDSPLSLPTEENLLNGIERIQEELLIDADTIIQLVVNLASGRHVLLAGPVGTGKTSLALMISKLLWKDKIGYYPEVYTANAEWSTHDVIGGITPRIHEGKPTYEITLGCASETVASNWSKEQPNKRTYNIREGTDYRGTWLVIDEFNRADIDKAFGTLFTALETRTLKLPTSASGRSYDEIRIPLDYRIIGTLNTADKHYLFKLSDALKRRFAYVEVLPPTIEQRETEIYYAIKNALKALDSGETKYFTSLLILDNNSRAIDRTNSDKELLKVIDKAYDVLHFIRLTKQLGTAILKSIYQTILIAFRVTGDYNKSMDLALNANLIPQLENVQTTTLHTIFELFFGDAPGFFKRKYDSSEKDQYVNDFINFLKCIEAENQHEKVLAFEQGKSSQNLWDSIIVSYNNNRTILDR